MNRLVRLIQYYHPDPFDPEARMSRSVHLDLSDQYFQSPRENLPALSVLSVRKRLCDPSAREKLPGQLVLSNLQFQRVQLHPLIHCYRWVLYFPYYPAVPLLPWVR